MLLLKKVLRKIRNVFLLIPGFISFLREKKIIFMINGGLGSQMWQYAVGQAIEKKSRVPVYYDTEFYKHWGKDCSGQFNRNWELDSVFSTITVKKASACEVSFYKMFLGKRYSTNRTVTTFIEEILLSKQPRYLGEYYNHIQYVDFIEKALRDQFIFDTMSFSKDTVEMAKTIKNTPCAVAVQVRRGDFVTVGTDKLSPSEYFYKAIDKIKNCMIEQNSGKIVFFIFSNDIQFCQNVLFSARKESFVFVDINDNDNGAQDMYLMSLCNHFILSAHSVFGWWGAFLSSADSSKIVIMPVSEEKSGMFLQGWTGV